MYNALAVPVAVGVIYPVFGILLTPIFKAAAMALSSVSVIGNAFRMGGRGYRVGAWPPTCTREAEGHTTREQANGDRGSPKVGR